MNYKIVFDQCDGLVSMIALHNDTGASHQYGHLLLFGYLGVTFSPAHTAYKLGH